VIPSPDAYRTAITWRAAAMASRRVSALTAIVSSRTARLRSSSAMISYWPAPCEVARHRETGVFRYSRVGSVPMRSVQPRPASSRMTWLARLLRWW
jgi:hypothetical protein